MNERVSNHLSAARVGHTDLQVARFGLGTAPLGNPGTRVSPEQATETIHYAIDHGINLIDTAPLYGPAYSEHYLGLALKDVPRNLYVMATKVGHLVTPEGEVEIDYTREGIMRSIEASLARLRIDRLDIVHIHEPVGYNAEMSSTFRRTALDVVFPVLSELREEGMIGAIGAGLNGWELLADFARAADFDCFLLAGRYTLLEQGALDVFLPLCQAEGISVFLGGVYNSGILATGARPGAQYNYDEAPPEIKDRVGRIEAVCRAHGVPLNVAALQFPLAHPAVTSVVVGATSSAEVAANLQSLETAVPSILWRDLKAEGLIHEAAPLPS